jgi:hypothetical protein
MQPWSQPLLWQGGSASPGDPYWSNVVLLMGFEDVNGSIGAPGMNDESPSAHGTATRNGVAQITTSQFKFGGSSIDLTGAGNAISFPDSNDWNFAAGNYTVELWIYFTSISVQEFFVGQWNTVGNLGWVLSTTASNQLAFNVSTTGSDNITVFTPAAGWALNTWYHVAVDWDGVKTRGYVNGVMIGSNTTARTIFNSPNTLAIGSNSAFNSFFVRGYIDELRITKGVARYATDTSFPVPTAAFPRHA